MKKKIGALIPFLEKGKTFRPTLFLDLPLFGENSGGKIHVEHIKNHQITKKCILQRPDILNAFHQAYMHTQPYIQWRFWSNFCPEEEDEYFLVSVLWEHPQSILRYKVFSKTIEFLNDSKKSGWEKQIMSIVKPGYSFRGLWMYTQEQPWEVFVFLQECLRNYRLSFPTIMDVIKNVPDPWIYHEPSRSVFDIGKSMRWIVLPKAKPGLENTVSEMREKGNAQDIVKFLNIEEMWNLVEAWDVEKDVAKEKFEKMCCNHFEQDADEQEIQNFGKSLLLKWKNRGHRFLFPYMFIPNFDGHGHYPFEFNADIVFQHYLLNIPQKQIIGESCKDPLSMQHFSAEINALLQSEMTEKCIPYAFVVKEYKKYCKNMLHTDYYEKVDPLLLSLYLLRKFVQWLEFWGSRGYSICLVIK